MTERVIRTEVGGRVSLERRRGLDGPAIAAALEQAPATGRAELAADDQVSAGRRPGGDPPSPGRTGPGSGLTPRSSHPRDGLAPEETG